MSVLLQATLLALLMAAATAVYNGPGVNLGPTYTLQNYISVDNSKDRQAKIKNFSMNGKEYFSEVEYFEWQGYDGWFNNPAHPEWGGAGKPYKLICADILY